MKAFAAAILATALFSHAAAGAATADAIPGHSLMVVQMATQQVRSFFRQTPEMLRIDKVRANADSSVVCVTVTAPKSALYVFVRGRLRTDDYAFVACDGVGFSDMSAAIAQAATAH